jgi:hypothetical protein
MTLETDDQPTLSPKILTEEKDLLTRAVYKWLNFQTDMWSQINEKLEREVKVYSLWSVVFRVTIIILSASVTMISDIDLVPRTAVTIVAGVLTALTGIEAYLKFGEQQSETRRQQREIEALRDKLRFEWFSEVEIEGDMGKRIKAAKRLLEEGPEAYNEVLNKYVLKGETDQEPQVNA